MKMKTMFFYIIMLSSFLNADISQNEFDFLDISYDINFRLGDTFSKVLDTYSDVKLIGEKKYSNIIYKEYGYCGLLFSISAYAENEREARILGMKTTSKKYVTKRKISIGSTQDDVIKTYGNADYMDKNKFIYLNIEYDHMELIFHFGSDGKVNTIEMITGT